MEPRHRLQQRGELVDVAFIEKCRKLVESVGRDLLECVGGHGVLQSTGCPWFLHTQRNPTTLSGGHGFAIEPPNTAAFLTGRASGLCWHDAQRPVSARRCDRA